MAHQVRPLPTIRRRRGRHVLSHGEALQSRDVVRAQALIQEGERLFGRAAMVDAVQLQASQDQQDRMAEHYVAMDAVRDVEEPYYDEDR